MITPKKSTGGGYTAQFRHPLMDGRVCKYGLGCRDEFEAKKICAQIEQLRTRCAELPKPWINKNGVWIVDQAQACAAARQAANWGFDGRAVEIFCGSAAPDDADEATPYDVLLEAFTSSSPEAYNLIHTELPTLREENKLLREKCEQLQNDMNYLRRKHGVHCKVKLGEAYARWAEYYPGQHARATWRKALAIVQRFCLSAGENTLLRDVRGSHVADFIARYRNRGAAMRQTEAALEQARKARNTPEIARLEARVAELARPSGTTLLNAYRYVSTFWSWAVLNYDLPENPCAKCRPPSRGSRDRESITAFRRQEDLAAVLAALEKEPYWQAWVAVAVLAGPRWDEIAHLRLADYNADQGVLHVFGEKTKRSKALTMRRTPVERSVLLPILTRHCATREREIASPDSSPALRSGLLFPALTSGARSIPRAEHVWVYESWLDAWRAVRARAGGPEEYWNWTGKDWRHCAASAMGASGVDSGRICAWLGNSEAVARAHYVAPPGARLWTFRWSV